MKKDRSLYLALGASLVAACAAFLLIPDAHGPGGGREPVASVRSAAAPSGEGRVDGTGGAGRVPGDRTSAAALVREVAAGVSASSVASPVAAPQGPGGFPPTGIPDAVAGIDPAGNRVGLDDIPPGRFRNELAALAPEARDRALAWLGTFHWRGIHVDLLHADVAGGIFTHEPLPPGMDAEAADGVGPESEGLPVVSAAAVPVSSPPIHHSKPGASRIIFLDFNGGIVSERAWNSSVASFDCKPYSSDSDSTTFSDAEQAAIQQIWQRVAEDYAPFDIDVTTEEPTSAQWSSNKVAWAMLTPTVDKNGAACPHNGYGGIAYVGIFGGTTNNFYSPAWVNVDMGTQNAAEAASHELGHNFGLSHDGNSAAEYHGGFNATANAPSWGPIMGAPYGRNVIHWSKGEYYDANRTQDDLAIISGKVPYRADDFGDTIATASPLPMSDAITVSGSGRIETSGDPDVFVFTTGAGTIGFSATTYKASSGSWGSNLDILLELQDASGAVLASGNPATACDASISYAAAGGTYYLVVKPTGAGTPMSSVGYTVYGSLGTYALSGAILPASGIVVTSPNTAESWLRGSTRTITWVSDLGGNVKIELLRGAAVESTIVATTPNDGAYDWTMPAGQALAGDYKVRITSVETPAKTDSSNVPFSVAGLGDGVWTRTGSGSWLSGANWQGYLIGGGSGAIADFGTLDIAANATVTLDGARTLGSLRFGDANATHGWTLAAGTGGPLTLAVSSGTPSVTVDNQTATISVALAGTQGLAKAGAGTLVLAAPSTYTGTTTVAGGTLRLTGGANTANGCLVGAIVVGNGGTLEVGALDALGWTAGRGALTINEGGTVSVASGLRATVRNTVNMTGGTLTGVGSGDQWGNYSLFGGAGVAATSAASGTPATIACAKLALQDSGGQTSFNVARGTAAPAADLVVSGAIVAMNNSTNGISKTGGGILLLSGANTYAGATAVGAGTLLVNGSLPATTTTVATGARLGGTGTLSGATTVHGTVKPGVAAAGTLTINNTATLSATGSVTVDVVANAAATAGTDFDRLVATALNVTSGATVNLVFNAPGSTVDFGNAFWSTAQRFKVVSTTNAVATAPALGTLTADSLGQSCAAHGSFSVEVAADTLGVEVVWTPSPLSAWRDAWFGTTENSGVAADTADPDGDGRSNLLEYAIGANPTVSDARTGIGSKVQVSSVDGLRHLNAIVSVNAAATDVTVSVEFASSTSGPWTNIMTCTTDAQGRHVYTDPVVSTPGSPRFFRVVVTPL